MGVNCVVNLPVDVDEHDVAEVVGILAGLSPTWEETSNGRFLRVDGAEGVATSVAGMSEVQLDWPKKKPGALVDGTDYHSASFHYSLREKGKIHNCFYPKSTPFWCAISRRLVWWFGGVVTFDDCSEKDIYRSKRHCPVDRYGLIPNDGKPWTDYHNTLAVMEPLTLKDLKAAYKVAAYKGIPLPGSKKELVK